MNILSSPKFRFTVGCAALLVVSLASSYLYTQSKTKHLDRQNQPFNQQESFAPLQSQISLASNFQSAFVDREISDEVIGKPNAFLSQQNLSAASAPFTVVDEFKKY